jgi:hypothetical protein
MRGTVGQNEGGLVCTGSDGLKVGVGSEEVIHERQEGRYLRWYCRDHLGPP